MTTRRDWSGEPYAAADAERTPVPLVPAPAGGGRWTPEEIQVVGWALVGAVLYLLGIVVCGAGLVAVFGWWVGGALVLLAGGVPAGYSLVKTHQVRAARERREHGDKFRGDREGLVPGMLASSPTVRTID